MGVVVVVAVVVAGAIAAAALYLHYWKKKKQAARPEVARTATRATRATHGADERADQDDGGGVGEGVPPPYLQMAVAGVPTAATAEQGVPVGLPVAACADGSWAPSSGGGADAADPESGEVTDSFQQRYQSHQHREGFVVATGFVPNV